MTTSMLYFHEDPKTPVEFAENAMSMAREEMVKAINEANTEHRALLFRRAAKWMRSAVSHISAEAISAEDIVRGENEMKSRHPNTRALWGDR